MFWLGFHLLAANPGLLETIDANLNPMNSEIESACRIYQFK